MNLFKKHSLFLFVLLAGLTFFSCEKDTDCNGACPSGYECVDNVCVEINPQPCGGVCPQGFDCVNEQCVAQNACDGVSCPDGQVCDNGTCVEIEIESVVVSGVINTNTTWTANKIYELASKVYVTEGAVLTIEAGTIIKGREGVGSLATALVITRGAQIIAEGTATAPIIFTSSLDDIKPGDISGTILGKSDNGKWGGLILLGNAPISAGTGDTEAQIEGIPGDEIYGKYGGTVADDNSGILKYLSVRHGGALIGDGNEINGITFGGVGNGTVVDHIEVVANFDDGVEFFGGTVNVTNLMVTYQDDDAIDIDQNYSGTIENFYVVHGGSGTDEGLEIDGPEGSTYTDGLFTLKKGTIVAADQEVTSAADLKSKAQGTITGVVWKGYSSLLKVRASYQDDCTVKSDAITNIADGKLIVADNEFVGSFESADLAKTYIDKKSSEAVMACFEAAKGEAEAALDVAVAAANNAIVAEATIGADMSEFDAWTWTAVNNEIK